MYVLRSLIYYAIVHCLAFVAVPLVALRDIATDLIMTPFRQVYAETRRHVERYVAFQLIRPLKPEYRASWRTHGLSLTAGHPG